jgi:hypothetical protein
VTGKKTWVMASFTPAFVASTSARRDSSVENSRRYSITVPEVITLCSVTRNRRVKRRT